MTPMNDDPYSSIFLPDIIRAMMNEMGRWTGSIFEVQMPGLDSLQGRRGHWGHYSSVRSKDTHLLLTSDVMAWRESL